MKPTNYLKFSANTTNNMFCSRKNPFGLYVALDDANKAAGMLFWDDGDSLGK